MAINRLENELNSTDKYVLVGTAISDSTLGAYTKKLTQNTDRVRSISVLEYALLFVLFFAYYLTAKQTLEDYDSVNLAMAVLNYDLTQDAPHPPGAPLFIAAVKLVHWFVGNIPVALTLVAAFGGAIFVCVWQRIFRAVLAERTAVVATVILAFSPGLWMTASQAMSDTLAAAALSVSILLALHYAKYRECKYLLCFSAALALSVGIRPQFGLFVPFLLFATFLYFKPAVNTVIKAVMVFTAVNLCWLIPTVVSQYNLDGAGWMTYFNQIARFKESFDTASGSPLLANNMQLDSIIYRAATHIGTMGYFSLGLNMWYPESVGAVLSKLGTTLNPWPVGKKEWTTFGSFYTLAYAFGAIALLPRIRYYWSQAKYVSQPFGYLLLVSIAYFIVVVMLVPPHTRFYLVLLPCFILIPLMGLQSRRWGHKIQYGFMVIAVLASLHTILDSIRLEAPPIALIKEIQKQTNSDGEGSVLLLNANAARHASWYLKQADIYGGHEKPAPSESKEVFKPGLRVFSNYPNAFPDELVQTTELGYFYRPYRIWMRHTSTPLYELSLRPLPIAVDQQAPRSIQTIASEVLAKVEPEMEDEPETGQLHHAVQPEKTMALASVGGD